MKTLTPAAKTWQSPQQEPYHGKLHGLGVTLPTAENAGGRNCGLRGNTQTDPGLGSGTGSLLYLAAKPPLCPLAPTSLSA